MKTNLFDRQYVVYTDLDEVHTFHTSSRQEALNYAHRLVIDEKMDISHICIVKRSFYSLNF